MVSRDAELFREKIEVSLDGRQIFYLFFGGAVIASLVFVLGVMVGRRVEARSVDGLAAASPARDPLAALDQLEESEAELAFPAALRGGDAELGSVDEKLAPGGAAELKAAAEPATEPEKKEAPAPAAEKKAEEPAPKPEPKAEEAVAEPAPEPKQEPKFTLQVGSFQVRSEAEAFHQDLRARGYEPWIAQVDLEEKGVWFRVRVGGYDSYDAALAGKAKFEDAEHIIAYVTRLRR